MKIREEKVSPAELKKITRLIAEAEKERMEGKLTKLEDL